MCMQRIEWYSILICLLVLTSGCALFKRDTPTPLPPVPINPGVHNKVILTVQGPSDVTNLNNLAAAFTKLNFVHDVSIVSGEGVVTICLVPGMTYDIVQLQRTSLDNGYRVLKAGEITW